MTTSNPNQNYYNRHVGQYPNYVDGQVNRPPVRKMKSKPIAPKRKAKRGGKRMARRKSNNMSMGKFNPLGIGFIFAVIYFSSTVSGLLGGFWTSLNLPAMGSLQSVGIMALTAVVFYWIAKQLGVIRI